MPPEIQLHIDQNMALSSDERLQRDCERLNSEPGKLTGHACSKCLNRGLIYFVRDGEIVAGQCLCAEIRAEMRRISNSGLADLLNSCTLDSFQTPEPWQRHMKKLAELFVSEAGANGSWFYVGGQVGAGKTHLCAAIVGNFLRAGKAARYMLWRDEVVALKPSVNDDVEYAQRINPLKTVGVLYVDDLFKSGAGKSPTPADVNIAFELLNHRYINRQLVTVLSSEWSVDELLSFDEAVGSRIYERTREFCMFIDRDTGRNWRLRK